MKAVYGFLVGNSIVTPIGLALAVLAAYAVLHARLAYAGITLIAVLLVTLSMSVLEKPN